METLTIAIRPQRATAIQDTVARAQAGDVAAFEQLYRENVGRIYAVCLRMVRDSHQAEELTQEAFVRAWQKLSGFRGDSAFSTWLHRLAVNLVLSDVRKRSRLNARELSADAWPENEPIAPFAVPGHRVDLEEALGHLPQGARAVFVLHDVEGYRHAEIAGQLGIATGTSKAQLHRARRILREILR